jgi:DNA-directed RNA polymerase specialized sigma24 family protein
MQIADRRAIPDPPTAGVTSPEAVGPAADTFEAFVRNTEPRLRRALVAAYGPEQGRDAAAEALAYAWEHWDRLRQMANAPGYLFRVGQTRGR